MSENGKTPRLIKTFLALSNDALSKGELPSSLTLLVFGRNPTDRGSLLVNERTVAAIQTQLAGQVYDRVLVDFEHNSEPRSKNFQPPPRKHAGAGRVFCSAERGLGIESIDWTPSGKEFARDYPDLSPCVLTAQPLSAGDGAVDEVVLGLSSVALVPNGGVKGLSFFSAQPQGDDPMSTAADPTVEITALKTALSALTTQVAQLATQISAMQQADYAAKQTALEGRIQTFEATVKADLARRDRESILADACRSGKVVALSADAIDKLTPQELKDHVTKLAVTVPVDRRTPFNALPATAGAGETQSFLEQYNAIKDPRERATFFQANRRHLVPSGH